MAKRRKVDHLYVAPDFEPDRDIPPMRVLVLRPSESLVMDEIAKGLLAAGHQVMSLVYDMQGAFQSYPEMAGSAGDAADRVLKFGPHFVLCNNGQGMDANHIILGLAEAEGIPVVTWFADSPTGWLKETLPPEMGRSLIVTYDQEHIARIRDMGYAHVEHLPLAVNPPVFPEPPEGHEPAIPLGYVGRLFSSMELGVEKPLEINLRKIYPAESSDPEKVLATIEEGIQHFSGLHVPDVSVAEWAEKRLQELLDQADPIFRPSPPKTALINYIVALIGHCASGATRRKLASRLEPLGLEAWGNPAWREIMADERCHEWVHYENLAAVYHRCAVNLSVSHRQNIGSVTLRLFDIPASGSFLLSDWRPCMADLFEPGEELIVFHSTEEACELAEKYSKDRDSRRKVVRAARQRVLAEHTYVYRIESLSRMLLERWPDLAERPRRRRKVIPHSPPEWSDKLMSNLAAELVFCGKPKSAGPLIEALDESDKPVVHRKLIDATEAFRNGKYEESLEKAQSAMEEGLDSATVWIIAGLAARLCRSRREALAFFLEAAKRRPYSPRFWIDSAEIFIDLGDWGRAKAAIMQALEADPN
ncbi:MAG: glycosyltransferase family protein, partial [Candidatus Sumerlaeota bacterium]